jgi:hypothetical protein
MTEMGRNPGRIIPRVQAFVDLHAGQHVRYVGEPIWASRSRAELREATKHSSTSRSPARTRRSCAPMTPRGSARRSSPRPGRPIRCCCPAVTGQRARSTPDRSASRPAAAPRCPPGRTPP